MTDQKPSLDFFFENKPKTNPISGGLCIALAFYLGYAGYPIYAIVTAVFFLAISEVLRFTFGPKRYQITLGAFVALLFTSTIICSMSFGMGRLAAWVVKATA